MAIIRLLAILGLDARHAPWRDRLLSGLGASLAILSILAVSRAFVGEGAGLVVASMGASAVLLFAVPHGPLSQPWQLLVGHLVSALVGVSCARAIGDPWSATALAVGLAVLAMRLTHSIHPPGGATALTAVIGGPGVTELGYSFVVTPVLLNATLMLVVAVAFNYPFAWRRYPAALPGPEAERPPAPAPIAHEDLVFALSEMDTFMDVSEQDLLQIYELAVRHAAEEIGPPPELAVHRCYSNGRYGADWQVREILAIRPAGRHGEPMVRFRIVAGQGRRRTALSSLPEFARWARYPVVRNENSWQRADCDPRGGEGEA